MNQSLSLAALETLSIIAYKQPITRVEVDDIRGVNSSGAITKLLSFDLIREDGKKEALGVPICMSRRSIFDYMGINHLEELPKVEGSGHRSRGRSIIFRENRELDEN